MRMTTIQVYSKKCGDECRKAVTTVGGDAKLSPPWYTYYRQVLNLFDKDPDLKISDLDQNSDTEYTFSIESQNGEKLQAIEKLIGKTKVIGNITVTIDYRYADAQEETWAKTIETAFEGNPYFKEVIAERDPILQVAFYYAVFSRDVISFWNDNLADYSGNQHYIPADLAKEVVTAKTNVNFCTESIKKN